MTWIKPDGTQIEVASEPARPGASHRTIHPEDAFGSGSEIALDRGISQGGVLREIVMEGTYALEIVATAFDQGFELDAEVVVYGRVYGWLGLTPCGATSSLGSSGGCRSPWCSA